MRLLDNGFFFSFRFHNARLVWEEIDEARINYDEVDELFSKVPIDNSRKSRLTKNKSPPKQVTILEEYFYLKLPIDIAINLKFFGYLFIIIEKSESMLKHDI